MNRRAFCLFLCSLPLPALAAAPTGGPGVHERDVEASYENGLYRGKLRLALPVSAPLAWEVLTDFDHMAEFVPNVEKSSVLSRDGNVVRVSQRGKVPFGPFSFRFESERLIDMRERDGLILARAVAGNTKHLQSETQLHVDGTTTVLHYRVEVALSRWLPSGVGISYLRRGMVTQFTAIAQEMVRRQQERQRTA